MPRKLKRRVGRPPGSKNKKKIKLEHLIKSEENTLSSQNDITPDTDITVLQIEVEDVEVEPFVNVTKEQKYFCKKCPNRYFKLPQNFQEHLINEHSTAPGSIPCKDCNVVCLNEDVLEMHVKKVHTRATYSCVHCGKMFARQAHVLRHMGQKGCGKTISQYPCEICKASFSRRDNLIVHLRLAHIRPNMFKCKTCAFSSKNITKLIRHWHAEHSETPNQFICEHCGKSTSSRAAMTKHLEIHGEKKYACDVCGYSTFTVEVMTRHVLTHVNDKPYKCSLCDKSYIQRSQLIRHMEKHAKQCLFCNEPVRTEDLIQHMEKHKGKTKLVCPLDYCASSKKEFANVNLLHEHIKTHIGEKSYSCEICKKKFPYELNMRRHMSTHTLDRPRRCMYCVSARAYVRGLQLVRHVRRYHPDVFRAHLAHVRNALNIQSTNDRVTMSELESILSVLDVESERILEGYSGVGVLYAGMQVVDNNAPNHDNEQDEDSPLMSEEMLAEHLSKLLVKLVDADVLECLGWPDESIDVILEKVIEQCGAKPADRDKWTRVQRLRENAKHLFLYVVDDKNVAKMLDTHTIDQIVKHILQQVTEDSSDEENEDKE